MRLFDVKRYVLEIKVKEVSLQLLHGLLLQYLELSSTMVQRGSTLKFEVTFFYIDCGQSHNSHFCWALYFLSLVIRTLVSLPSDIAPLEHLDSRPLGFLSPFGPGHIHDGRQQPQRRQTRQQLGRQGQHTVVGGIKPFLTISG